MALRYGSRIMLFLLALLFVFGCAQIAPKKFPASSLQELDSSLYTSKVDNFLINFDASSSMRHPYKGYSKFAIAKKVVEGINIVLPEMGQTAGLRSFGHAPEVSDEHNVLFYGMENYASAGLAVGLSKITKPGGFTPMWRTFESAMTDLEGLGGVHNAVIVVGDGLENQGSTIEYAQALKDKFGSSICFYPILVGDDPAGDALMNQIALIGGCGFAVNADTLLTDAGITDYVERVFLAKKEAPKMAAPAPAPVVEEKGRVDTDGDGVFDDVDECPGTPVGAFVNAKGCWTLTNVLFDFDKSAIKPEAFALLNNVVTILEKNPSMKIDLQGHTDNEGTPVYNMGLSMRRANAVKQYLVDKGISASRLTTQGFGLTKPVSTNESEIGRALNRRVELHPMQ